MSSLYHLKLSLDHLKHFFSNLFMQGQFFSAGQLQVYLLGNPIIWWGNMVFMVFYLVLWVSVGVRAKRRVTVTPREISKNLISYSSSLCQHINYINFSLPYQCCRKELSLPVAGFGLVGYFIIFHFGEWVAFFTFITIFLRCFSPAWCQVTKFIGNVSS